MMRSTLLTSEVSLGPRSVAVRVLTSAMKEILLSGLTIVSPLAFPLTLKSGQVIETVGDTASYFGTLTEEKHGYRHWQVAVRMSVGR
jgi:hypothetical protein